MTFFEIDPIVIEVASDPRYFTYLADAPARPTVIEGDARLSFEDEPGGRYDLLIMDAFSSDSVPVHLLTVEAIVDEIRITKPDGVVVFHISNRYYNLAPAIAAAVVGPGPDDPREEPHAGRGQGAGRDAVALARGIARRGHARTTARARAGRPVTPSDRPFTDDYADLLRYLNLACSASGGAGWSAWLGHEIGPLWRIRGRQVAVGEQAGGAWRIARRPRRARRRCPAASRSR